MISNNLTNISLTIHNLFANALSLGKTKIQPLGLAFFLALFLFACGPSEVEQVEVPDDPEVTYNPDTTGKMPLAIFEEVRTQRQKAGDTIAISHELLQKVLIREIPDYILESDKASTFTTQNFTFSEASKVFYNDQEDYIELVAGDYVANPDFIEVQLQRFNLSQDVEIQGVTDVKLDLSPFGKADQFFAWGSYNPRKRQALVNIGVNFRYIISISLTGVDAIPNKETIESWLNMSVLPG